MHRISNFKSAPVFPLRAATVWGHSVAAASTPCQRCDLQHEPQSHSSYRINCCSFIAQFCSLWISGTRKNPNQHAHQYKNPQANDHRWQLHHWLPSHHQQLGKTCYLHEHKKRECYSSCTVAMEKTPCTSTYQESSRKRRVNKSRFSDTEFAFPDCVQNWKPGLPSVQLRS